MARKILPKSPPEPMTKIEIPMSKADLHKGLDSILATATLKRAFSEILMQCLWVAKCTDKATQVKFSTALTRLLDSWREGGGQ